MNATERHPTSLQLWSGGKTVYYSGDPHGPDLRTHTGYADTTGTPATDDDRKAIRMELRAKRFVDEEILCCDSALVDELLQQSSDGNVYGDLSTAFSWEEVENLRADPSAWDLAQCKEWLEDNGHDLPDPNPWAMDREAMLEAIGEEGRSQFATDSDQADDSLRQWLINDIDEELVDGLDDWREAVRDNADDATVYQWFRVTPWFCERLREADEVVLDNNYGNWWGRQCAGQSLIMDGTLQRVAATQED